VLSFLLVATKKRNGEKKKRSGVSRDGSRTEGIFRNRELSTDYADDGGSASAGIYTSVKNPTLTRKGQRWGNRGGWTMMIGIRKLRRGRGYEDEDDAHL
jgi:hypothetical protein